MKGKKRECPDMPKEFFGEVLSDSTKVQGDAGTSVLSRQEVDRR